MTTATEKSIIKILGADTHEPRSPEVRPMATRFPAKAWAKSVQKLSDHYLSNPDAISPWNEPWAREALLSYYHPLNQARAERVARQGLKLGFFSGLKKIVDIGCGSGAASLGVLKALDLGTPELNAPSQHFPRTIESLELIDHSKAITEIAQKLVQESGLAPKSILTRHQSLHEMSDSRQNLNDETATMIVLSYVLTEMNASSALEKLLRARPDTEALMIIEPSTSQDARKLQALREPLMKMGFHIWGPCTHSKACPLLKDSDRDWCHDRLIPDKPIWWDELEAHLPMKNQTVTVSYLLARRKPRPRLTSPSVDSAPTDSVTEVRVIGDRLEEKTKVRQMICRGENREFISWFPSRLGNEAEDFQLSRGDHLLAQQNTWSDPRGIDRSKEFRLSLNAINGLKHLP